MRRISLGLALGSAIFTLGCMGAKAPAEQAQTGIQKGVAGQYYFVNLFTPPVGGTVTSDRGGIDCGATGVTVNSAVSPPQYVYVYSGTSNHCAQTRFEWSQDVTLTATPLGTNQFIGWAGDCSGDGTCTLSAGADKAVVAIFGPAGSGHTNFMNPATHGPAYLASVKPGAKLVCAGCHGATFAGQGIAPSCNDCHATAGFPNWQSNCTFCHAAPPSTQAHASVTPGLVTSCAGCHPETVTGAGAIVVGGKHQNGSVDVTSAHASGFGAASVHGPAFFDYLSGTGSLDCRTCHGQDLNGGSARSCDTCHASAGWTAWQTNCSFCHGEKSPATQPGGYDLALHPTYSAPPDAVSERLSGTPAPARTGAHAAHLTPSAFAGAFKCETCHAVPTSLTHIGGAASRATVTLVGAGQAALPASLGSYDPVSGTCTTYCHGTPPSPAWASTGLACGSCHALPPSTASGHPSVTADLATCSLCHASTMNPDGTIIPGGTHLNGDRDSSGMHGDYRAPATHGPRFLDYVAGLGSLDCKACHGASYGGGVGPSCNACHATTAGWTAWQANCSFCHGASDAAAKAGYNVALQPTWSAPPDAIAQRLDPAHAAAPARTGAHRAHLTGITSGGTALSSAFACQTCHAVPGDLSHIGGATSRATVALAGAGQATLPASLGSYSPASGTCTTYCHGAGNSPTWATTTIACASCHGTPPATGDHGGVTAGDLNACVGCHPDTMNGNGTVNAAGGKHVDGTVQAAGGACGSCHGIPDSTGQHDFHVTYATEYGSYIGHTPCNDPSTCEYDVTQTCLDCHPSTGNVHRNGTVEVIQNQDGVQITYQNGTCTTNCHSRPTPRSW